MLKYTIVPELNFLEGKYGLNSNFLSFMMLIYIMQRDFFHIKCHFFPLQTISKLLLIYIQFIYILVHIYRPAGYTLIKNLSKSQMCMMLMTSAVAIFGK